MSRLFTLALLTLATVELPAQRILLELRPRVGDTLRLRLDQTTEMSGSRRGGSSTTMIVTTMRMYSRAIVEGVSGRSATILAISDSVSVTSNDERARALVAETQRQLTGQQMRLRMAPDGTVSLSDPQPRLPREVSEMIAIMPASFPRASVAVGDTWIREMPIPPSTSMGVPLGGLVKAAIRLDSLTQDGQIAWLSMRGTMHPLSESVAISDPKAVVGSVVGTMVVDRHRGWLSESRFLIESRAVVAALAPGTMPMEFRLRITQHMRVIERR